MFRRSVADMDDEPMRVLSIEVYVEGDVDREDFAVRIHEAIANLCSCGNKRWRQRVRKLVGKTCTTQMISSRWTTDEVVNAEWELLQRAKKELTP